MVIALGITLAGEKRVLGFVETDTENARVLTLFLRSLVERGLDLSQGVLVILDGGTGLRAAVRTAFRHRALVQRCQWHKRETVVSHLAKNEQAVWRPRLQRAYNRPDYDEALGALETLHGELDERNQSAAGSLAEGLDETLTLHRLGVYGVLGRSLKTTNGLESVNALVTPSGTAHASQRDQAARGESPAARGATAPALHRTESASCDPGRSASAPRPVRRGHPGLCSIGPRDCRILSIVGKRSPSNVICEGSSGFQVADLDACGGLEWVRVASPDAGP